ncbi:MAG: hypothetical protein V1934_08905 [Methanobacteriota archaeon]
MAYPYYGPAWYPQPAPEETKKGLANIVRAMYLTLIVMVLVLVIVSVAFTSLAGFEDIQAPEDISSSMMGAIAVLAVSALVLLVVGLAALVYYLMGIVKIHRGRHEFGPPHAERVRKALIFIGVAFVISIVGSGISAAIIFDSNMMMGQTSPVDLGQYRQDLILSSAIGGTFSVVSAAFWNLAVVNLVRELADDKHKGYLQAGFWVGVATTIGSTVLSVALVAVQAEDALAGFNDMNVLSILPVGLSLISFAIYLACYKHALGRLESGELKPIQPPAPPMPQYPPGAYYPPPGYYQAPPPAYQQPPPGWQPPAQQHPPKKEE